MDIADSFTTKVITAAGVDVGDELEDELKSTITTVLGPEGAEVPEQLMEAFMLCFIAGRAYQANQMVLVEMSPTMIRKLAVLALSVTVPEYLAEGEQ